MSLYTIMMAQNEAVKDIPIPMVGNGRTTPIRPAKIVDLTTRHYAGFGLRGRNKALTKAKKDLKAANKKLCRDIYLYNFNGIKEHGLAWTHMNHSQKLAWFKTLVMSDQRIPTDALEWGQKRGLI